MATPIISNLQPIAGSPNSRSFTVTLEPPANDRDNVTYIAAWTCPTDEIPADPHFVPEYATLISKDSSTPYTWYCAIMDNCTNGRTLCAVTVETWHGGRATFSFQDAGNG